MPELQPGILKRKELFDPLGHLEGAEYQKAYFERLGKSELAKQITPEFYEQNKAVFDITKAVQRTAVQRQWEDSQKESLEKVLSDFDKEQGIFLPARTNAIPTVHSPHVSILSPRQRKHQIARQKLAARYENPFFRDPGARKFIGREAAKEGLTSYQYRRLNPYKAMLFEAQAKFGDKAPKDFWESLEEEVTSGRVVPFVGDIITIADFMNVTRDQRLAQMDPEIRKDQLRRTVQGMVAADRPIYQGTDKERLEAATEDINAAKERVSQRFDKIIEGMTRGQTFGGKIGTGVGGSVPFMLEFLATYGLAKTAKAATKKGFASIAKKRALKQLDNLTKKMVSEKAKKKLAEYAAKNIKKNLFVDAVGNVAGAFLQTSLGFQQKIAADMARKFMPTVGVNPETGKLTLVNQEGSVGKEYLDSFVSTWIENFSEVALSQAASRAGKVLEKGAKKIPLIGEHTAKIMNALGKFRAGGPFSNIAEEMGEEALSHFLRYGVGVGDVKDPFMSWEELGVTLGVITAQSGGGLAVGRSTQGILKAINRIENTKVRKKEATKALGFEPGTPWDIVEKRLNTLLEQGQKDLEQRSRKKKEEKIKGDPIIGTTHTTKLRFVPQIERHGEKFDVIIPSRGEDLSDFGVETHYIFKEESDAKEFLKSEREKFRIQDKIETKKAQQKKEPVVPQPRVTLTVDTPDLAKFGKPRVVPREDGGADVVENEGYGFTLYHRFDNVDSAIRFRDSLDAQRPARSTSSEKERREGPFIKSVQQAETKEESDAARVAMNRRLFGTRTVFRDVDGGVEATLFEGTTPLGTMFFPSDNITEAMQRAEVFMEQVSKSMARDPVSKRAGIATQAPRLNIAWTLENTEQVPGTPYYTEFPSNASQGFQDRILDRGYVKSFLIQMEGIIEKTGSRLYEIEGNVNHKNASLFGLQLTQHEYASIFPNFFSEKSEKGEDILRPAISFNPYMHLEKAMTAEGTGRADAKVRRVAAINSVETLLHEFAHINMLDIEPGHVSMLMEAEMARLRNILGSEFLNELEELFYNLYGTLNTEEFRNDAKELKRTYVRGSRSSETSEQTRAAARVQRHQRPKRSAVEDAPDDSEGSPGKVKSLSSEELAENDTGEKEEDPPGITNPDEIEKVNNIVKKIRRVHGEWWELDKKRKLLKEKGEELSSDDKAKLDKADRDRSRLWGVLTTGVNIEGRKYKAAEGETLRDPGMGLNSKQVSKMLWPKGKRKSGKNSSISSSLRKVDKKTGIGELAEAETFGKLRRLESHLRNFLHRIYVGRVTPAKAFERVFGDEAYAKMMTFLFQPQSEMVKLFDAETLLLDPGFLKKEMDLTYNALGRMIDVYGKEHQQRLMYSWAGEAVETEGEIAQEHARENLTDRDKTMVNDLFGQISKKNWDDLFALDPTVDFFENYFLGTYKNTAKLRALLKDSVLRKVSTAMKKKKKIMSMADAVEHYGLEPKTWNPVWNLRTEYLMIANYRAMIQLRAYLRTRTDMYQIADAPPADGWDILPKGMGEFFGEGYFHPIARQLMSNLYGKNAFSKGGLKLIRSLWQVAQGVAFTLGPIFHLGTVTAQMLANAPIGSFLRPKSYRNLYRFMKKFRHPRNMVDPANMTVEDMNVFAEFLRTGGNIRDNHAAEFVTAYENFMTGTISENLYLSTAGELARLPLRVATIPFRALSRWTFHEFIPMVKFLEFSNWYKDFVKRKKQAPTDREMIEYNNHLQNLFGEMNEKLWGFSGTATSALRIMWIAPGFMLGDFLTMFKAGTQWKGGHHSRKAMFQYFTVKAVFASLITFWLTGKWKDPPEKVEDILDLWKIDTGQVYQDGPNKGKEIKIETLTVGKDYSIGLPAALEAFKGRPGKGALRLLEDFSKRMFSSVTGGIKSLSDIADITVRGKKLVDWKNKRLINVHDTTLQKMGKFFMQISSNFTPYGVAQGMRAKRNGMNAYQSILIALSGTRLGLSEKDKRENELAQLIRAYKSGDESLYFQMSKNGFTETEIEDWNQKVKDFMSLPEITPAKIKEFELDKKPLGVSIEEYDEYLAKEMYYISVKKKENHGEESYDDRQNLNRLAKAWVQRGYGEKDLKNIITRALKKKKKPKGYTPSVIRRINFLRRKNPTYRAKVTIKEFNSHKPGVEK